MTDPLIRSPRPLSRPSTHPGHLEQELDLKRRRGSSRTTVARAALSIVVVLALSVLVPKHCAATDLATVPIAVERITPRTDVTAAVPAIDIERLEARMRAATDFGAMNGARVSIAFMDRASGVRANNGNGEPIDTASVSKLFIADNLLFRDGNGEFTLRVNDITLIDFMLRSPDDAAAEQLWNRFGRNNIVGRVASRYGLSSTSVKPNDEWWRTRTTMNDVVTYYSKMIDGVGGLEPARSESILGNLKSFSATGSDGYYQRFGLPDALPGESVIAVKQGWMCCVGGDWIHLTTGFAGRGDRYIVALNSRESGRR
ncbi:serine hydrolase [Rhodococcus opacus]|uniref:serine hydrolase n=1 Tax=Rhodococcus opacus TaxID=37919 RepID=UPI00247305BE|nr:serine hydrolase [Rhodococcus opacus]MDH6293414.1 hypothetical protein [Rhodococcus opacus]